MNGQLEVGRLDERPAWQDDVALELWVDAEQIPVRIRLAGTLDEGTSPSLLAVVGDLLGSGVRQIELQTDGLRTVDPGGSAALVAAEGMVERSGGTFHRLPPGAEVRTEEGGRSGSPSRADV